MQAGVRHFLARLKTGTSPIIVILVGPNGAGKSTFYSRYLKSLKLPFINADVIGKGMVDAGAPSGEETERIAANLAERRRRELITKHESFVTETVFSDPVGAKVTALRDAQAAGYAVFMIFVCVDSVQLSAFRVQSRVSMGGHDVPPDKIEGRYERMRKNVKAALTFVDFAVILDNSFLDVPLRFVALVESGKVSVKIRDVPWWAKDVLSAL